MEFTRLAIIKNKKHDTHLETSIHTIYIYENFKLFRHTCNRISLNFQRYINYIFYLYFTVLIIMKKTTYK